MTWQLHLQGKAPSAHWLESRVGCRAGLEAMKRKVFAKKRSHSPGRPARKLVNIGCSLSLIHEMSVTQIVVSKGKKQEGKAIRRGP